MNKNQDIQVLRGIAIILVVLQHYRNRLPTPDWYHGMFDHVAFWGGVDIFFAISGYLIYKTFARDMDVEPSKFDAIRGFARRRFLRLYPASLFWVCFSVVVSLIVTTAAHNDPMKIAQSGLSALMGWSNFYYVHCLPDIASCGNPDFNGVTWSLSAEWQFYAILSLLMLIVGKRTAVLALLAIAIVMSSFPAPSWSLLWAIRPLAFILGAFIASITSTKALRIPPTIAMLALCSGIALVVLAPVKLDQPLVVPALALGGALCLLSALGGANYSGPLSGPVRWIGERSYSIYLCHLPIILLTREAMTRLGMMDATFFNTAVSMLIVATLILTASHISFLLIETRVQRKFGRRHQETSAARSDRSERIS